MGYSWNGRCYETNTDALTAFKTEFPKVDTFGRVHLVSASVSGQTITFEVYQKPWTSATETRFSSQSLWIGSCTDSYVNKFETLAVQDILVGLALAFAFVIGMAMGWNR